MINNEYYANSEDSALKSEYKEINGDTHLLVMNKIFGNWRVPSLEHVQFCLCPGGLRLFSLYHFQTCLRSLGAPERTHP